MSLDGGGGVDDAGEDGDTNGGEVPTGEADVTGTGAGSDIQLSPARPTGSSVTAGARFSATAGVWLSSPSLVAARSS